MTQGSYEWCWAATCASILNYKKGLNLQAVDVVKYIYGGVVNKGGTPSQCQKAYTHWGYSMIYTSTLNFYNVKTKLKGKWPMHMYLYTSNSGHCMTLRGFEEYSSGEIIYYLIDPNKTYYVSVTGSDNGRDVYYILNNQMYFWQNSIY